MIALSIYFLKRPKKSFGREYTNNLPSNQILRVFKDNYRFFYDKFQLNSYVFDTNLNQSDADIVKQYKIAWFGFLK